MLSVYFLTHMILMLNGFFSLGKSFFSLSVIKRDCLLLQQKYKLILHHNKIFIVKLLSRGMKNVNDHAPKVQNSFQKVSRFAYYPGVGKKSKLIQSYVP